MTRDWHNSKHRETVRIASRRRGSILVLVMTILGLLFVIGLAFMATMNFEAGLLAGAREQTRIQPGAAQLDDQFSDLLRDSMMPLAGWDFTGQLLGGSPMTFAEMPGVHNSFSPIEPYRDPVTGVMYFAWATDIGALKTGPFAGSNMTLTAGSDVTSFIAPIDTTAQSGNTTNAHAPLDADGDGIADSVAVDLTDPALGVDGRVIRELARAVNPSSNPDGPVYLGLRIIAHGGMVNLGESHPHMIRAVLGSKSLDLSQPIPLPYPPFSPLVEEASLRRRNFLPPEVLAPGNIQGNPWSSDPDACEGRFDRELFAQVPFKSRDLTGGSCREHRYWPYKPEEKGPDPDIPLWALRMDADGATNDPTSNNDAYDRRHLVTSVSHDDLLRRPTWLEIRNPTTLALIRNADVLTLMNEANKTFVQNMATPTCSWVDAMGALAPPPLPSLPFEYANYPYLVPNRYTGDVMPFNLYDSCACMDMNNAQCGLNRLKGQLRLSLPWLDNLRDIAPLEFERKKRLIQDAFTLMLFNARGPQWGTYQVPVTLPPLPPPEWKWNDPTHHDIAVAAASLTANMLDYADADDEPTRVEVRSADLADPDKAGRPFLSPEYVYGLEKQPFITEVIARVTNLPSPPAPPGTPDPANTFYGIELFNPYSTAMNLNQYSIGGTPPFILSGTIPPKSFVAFLNDSSGIIPAPASGTRSTSPGTFTFTTGSAVRLLRTVSGGASIVVDQFKLAGTKVADPDGMVHSVQRAASPGTPWTAPIPLDPPNTTALETFGLPGGLVDTMISPVQVEFANVPATVTLNYLATAFPTTGSLLLLMRHANSETTAFTSYLTETDATGYYAIDNGRMPVFDLRKNHRIAPEDEPPFIHPTDASLNGKSLDRPGDLMHLPWGLLVFDYFTALPVAAPGPYTRNLATGLLAVDENAGPRVDLDGLRVHGRININAAPWMVMQGIPFVPMSKIPARFRDDFRSALGFNAAEDMNSLPIGPERAKAVVAYRELRQLVHDDPVTGNLEYTGNYDDGSFGDPPTSTPEIGRGWDVGANSPYVAPSFRRGTGFMTVGELANVRHRGATGRYRLDSGEIDPSVPGRNYVNAIAALASLSDWVTARSQVFTVYGTVRGGMDDTIVDDMDSRRELDMRIKDVDSRALRFQETMDRLPMFLGSPAPARIGERVLGRYNDTRGG